MEVKLVVTAGKHAGQEIKITREFFEIGKSPKCQLRPGGDEVERHHCVLIQREGYAGIRDNKTAAGTFVNDQRVEGEQELKNGDVLRVGALSFEVQLTVGVSGKKMAKVQSISEAASRAAQKKAQKSHKEAEDEDLDVFAIFGEEEPSEEELPSFITRKKNTDDAEADGDSIDPMSLEKKKQESTRNAAADTIKAILNQTKLNSGGK